MSESMTIDINCLPAGISAGEVLEYYNTTGTQFIPHQPTDSKDIWKSIEIKQEGTFLENIER